jgi:transcriptional regulator with XRE-family HTH domain
MSEHIGTTIKRLREQQEMTISELSRISGVSRGYIHLIEKGENNPTSDKLEALAKALGAKYEFSGIEDEDDIPQNLPESLQEFAKEYNVPYTDIIMLSKIQYRGKRPDSKMAWKMLYDLIKSATDEE